MDKIHTLKGQFEAFQIGLPISEPVLSNNGGKIEEILTYTFKKFVKLKWFFNVGNWYPIIVR